MSPRGGSTPRQTDWLTVSCNVTLALTLTDSELVRELEDSSTRELQMKGASQWGQGTLDTEVDDATLLEAATKQHSEDRDWEH
jgi:hypothetical protein